MKLIVGITGATGTIFGVRLLEFLKNSGVESHLMISKWGARTLIHETPHTIESVKGLATCTYSPTDQGEEISSASCITDGMVVAPCSMRSLAAIANGLGDNLIHLAAYVILKERLTLALIIRESPLND